MSVVNKKNKRNNVCFGAINFIFSDYQVLFKLNWKISITFQLSSLQLNTNYSTGEYSCYIQAPNK